MKMQEVILRAMAGKLKRWEATEIIGVTDRTMRRSRERYEHYGYDGLYDRRKGQPSPKRVPVERLEEVLLLYQEKYLDFNVRPSHQKLVEEHGLDLSYTWVKAARQGAGLVEKSRRRGVHRRRRPRRPLPGMLLHMDASEHGWFQDERWYDLLTVLDDATSEIYYRQLADEESTRTVMAGLREVPEPEGAFYLFPRIAGLKDSFDFCRRLLEETNVGLAPGVAFGAGGEGSLRICYAAERSILEPALERLGQFLRAR